MFWITEDPSSGSLVQCLAKNYKNDSIVSVDMDKVSVMEAYSDPLCVCSSLYMKALIYSEGSELFTNMRHNTYGVARYLRNKRPTKYCTILSKTLVHSLPKPSHNLEFQVQETYLEITC